MIDTKRVRQQAKLELARREFWDYCNLMAPKFYTPEREYLKQLCSGLNDFIRSDDDFLIINMPPRHGKSRTATLFTEWLFGENRNLKIMTASYNETISTVFSKSVRNTISEVKADEDKVVYSDIFPDTRIARGDGAMGLWSLEGGYNNYLATSPKGAATGFGADIMLVDDVIKTAAEAFNANTLEEHWNWFVNTLLSRLESGGKGIIIMTRWSSKDLAGRASTTLVDSGYKVRQLVMTALQEDGTMLCEDVLSLEEYNRRAKTSSPEIFAANYQQKPIDRTGQLYSHFKTYNELPRFSAIKSYTDTADTGSDNYASFIYGETFDHEAYILDVIYTKAPMEETEALQVAKLNQWKVNLANIESNNGGRGHARIVEERLHAINNYSTVIKWFHQSGNKDARILSNSAWVVEHIYFPTAWGTKWPDLYRDLTEYQRAGKNLHDDAPDALTGVAEAIQGKIKGPDTKILKSIF